MLLNLLNRKIKLCKRVSSYGTQCLIDSFFFFHLPCIDSEIGTELIPSKQQKNKRYMNIFQVEKKRNNIGSNKLTIQLCIPTFFLMLIIVLMSYL